MMDKSGLNLTSSTEANMSSNYIYSIDPILPPKSQVISFIDGDTDVVPVVKAKVMYCLVTIYTV